MVKIQARHSGRGARAATSDEAGSLKAVLFLTTKAEVMLTCNLWAEVGICNGSFGTVKQFWFVENIGPSNLPIVVLVHFPAYSGPAYLQEGTKCIPVPPRVFEWMADGKFSKTTIALAAAVCYDHTQVSRADTNQSCC